MLHTHAVNNTVTISLDQPVYLADTDSIRSTYRAIMLNGVTTRMVTSSEHDALPNTVENTVKFDAMTQYLSMANTDEFARILSV
ncbi:hypothetical protein [Pseudoduganella ginsengisoli]|uniref:Uncharacterized protein n=1 Tax=Pseudoduganella ginsengisoli TaxID=1462440 RepID=A0A6L6Q534_9BURK|nr:hypothetical protein [Pseudoduganella ginsengisoli]MTW04371.1 hypothetical protein [Pseudoduganella ginsengisoli]